MFESYKAFLLDPEMLEWISWANAVKDDDVEKFLSLFDPSDDQVIFDPIELAIAFDSEGMYNYLIDQYDYSDFFNQVDFSLLVILLLFERENFLLKALESYSFDGEHMLSMYEYIIAHRDVEYFHQFYSLYPLHPSKHKELMNLALNHYDVFLYLADMDAMRTLIKDKTMVYDILAYYPQYLSFIEDIKDLSEYVDSDLFNHVVKLEYYEDFQAVMAFMLKRGFNMNTIGDFGLNLFHLALRHAREPRYIQWLITLGADQTMPTSLGYPPSHQLVLRNAKFTYELNDVINFNDKDADGLTLQDYDHMQHSNQLNYFDVLRLVRLVLNMDESHFYELSEEEFYHMTLLHGVEVFMPYVSIVVFENTSIKDRFTHELSHQNFNAYDMAALKDMFPGKIAHDLNKTLQLEVEFLGIDDEMIQTFQQFAKKHNTTLAIESEDDAINQKGQITYTFHPTGKLSKHAVVKSHLLDVYYLHFYFDIPLKNITYEPQLKDPQRFLN